LIYLIFSLFDFCKLIDFVPSNWSITRKIFADGNYRRKFPARALNAWNLKTR